MPFRVWFAALAASLGLLAACGSKPLSTGAADGGVIASDGGGVDAGSEDGGASEDGGVVASEDGGADAGAEDGGVATADGGVPIVDAGPPRPPGPYPHNGWLSATAHNGRVLPWDLSVVNEDELLLSGGRGALYALGGSYDDHHPDREPLILVHGLSGAPKDEQPIVDRVWWSTRYQLFAYCFDDFNRLTTLNGNDLADELRALAASYVAAPTRVTIMSHSLGGIATRWALDQLAAGAGGPAPRITSVRFVGVDNPWHGFDGPADGPLMDIARPFMPDGLEDMRALAPMFAGDPASSDPLFRVGLARVPLPESVAIHLVFAQQGDLVLDYTEGAMADLPDRIANAYLNNNAVQGEQKHLNLWDALRTSAAFPTLDAELRARGGALDGAFVRSVLLRLFPRFPGDHTGMLSEQPGQYSFLDYLTGLLAP